MTLILILASAAEATIGTASTTLAEATPTITTLAEATPTTTTLAETIATPTAKLLKIAVAKFTPKAPKYKKIDPTGAAFSDMLISALFKTNRFIILEREVLEEMEEELKLGKAEKVYVGADIMICGAVTGFEPDYKKTTIDLAAILTTIGCLFTLITREKAKALEDIEKGAAKIEIKKSYVALDLRVVDVRTREILGATRVETITKDVKWGIDLAAFHKSIGLAGAFEEYKNTPMEKAIYESLSKAVDYIVTIIESKRKS